MIQDTLIDALTAEQIKSDIPDFQVGDTISVHMRIIEGEKERIQVFTGIVIARKGAGISETVSLYRVSHGSGMERVFVLNSPKLVKFEVLKRGKVRKSKLYHLRGAFGKKAKVQEQIGPRVKKAMVAEAPVANAPAKEEAIPEEKGE
jgi:large subunit ribosomal protein L19